MKPRSDSKLKLLPEERQEQIIGWARSPKTDACPGGLQHAREQLALDGVKVSLTTLSEFVAWWELQRRFSAADSRARQVVELLKEKDPSLSPDKLRELGHALFTAEAIDSADAQTFVALERLDLDRRTAHSRGEIELEKLKIANRRVKLLEDRERKIKATLENGQLSAEQQADRIREIFKREKR
jgi:hypothetical protein